MEFARNLLYSPAASFDTDVFSARAIFTMFFNEGFLRARSGRPVVEDTLFAATDDRSSTVKPIPR